MATVRICPAHSQVPPKILWWIAHSPAQSVSWLPLAGGGHGVGGRDDNPAMRDPGRAWEVWNSEVDYAYAAEPQVHAAGITVFWLHGKVLGGSGSLNGMIYVRGHHADYGNWAYDGAAGWSYDEMAAPGLRTM
jgi:choline dehydrogenase-like flavoprotein